MPGIDRFVADTVTRKIKERFEKNTIKKIERKIFLENGLSIKLAIENFSLINYALKQNQIRDSSIKEIFKDILVVKRIVNCDYQIKIIDEKLIEDVFKVICDNESFLIIKVLMNDVNTTEDIIKSTHISKTSAYRKIQKMIQKGFLLIDSREKTKTRFSTKLRCLFKGIMMNIKQGKMEIILIISEENYKKSSLFEFI